MHGLMQDFPLTIQHIFWRAERLFPEKEIVTKTSDGIHRYTFKEFAERTRRLAAALIAAGVKPGDRVATFAWNHYMHHELYFAVPCIGAVLHTLNVRLFADQLEYIINHAEDRLIFYDESLSPVLDPLIPKLKTVERFVRMPADYEDFITSEAPITSWPNIDEKDAAGMCYTSGTTGNPKGVIYSHRSTVLHSFGVCTGNANGFTEADTTLAIVPMFHAMAWGQPYAATMAGCKQVYPGQYLTPDSICELLSEERVTISAGVPTIWIGVLDELKKKDYDLSHLRFITAGGAAVPRSLIEAFDERHGIPLIQGWGMTETSPVCALGHLKSNLADLPDGAKFSYRAKTGFPIPGVELRLVGDDGGEIPWDGKSFGELQVRGPWIASDYYNDPRSADSFDDGWLRTGDVATIDELGYIQLVDRTKDLVKSGGEWISSVELEKEIMGHPAVLEAAVIGVPHAKWSERPLACVVLREGAAATKKEIIEHLSTRVAKWWLPDEVVFIEEVPKTSVGKFDKKVLRQRFALEFKQ